jgi:MGT family glycosyltransferase
MAFADFAAPYRAEGLNLVFQPRSFQSNSGTFDDRYLFVGPSMRHEVVPEDFPFQQLDGRRVVFVSLGTVASDHPDFYRSCFEAFADSDWLVVAATGRTDPTELGPLPANVLARPFVPQLAILERARAFVSHGGMNSIMEALWLGVPLVVAPQMGDQPLVAQRIEDLGLGAALSPDEFSGFAIKEAVDQVATDPGIARRIAGMVIEMHHAGGATRAAAAVRRFVAGEKDLLLTQPV